MPAFEVQSIDCRPMRKQRERGFASLIVALGVLVSMAVLASAAFLAQGDALEALDGQQSGTGETLQRPLGLRGVVIAEADETGTRLQRMVLTIGTLGGSEAVDLAPHGHPGAIVVNYWDHDDLVADVAYTVEWLGGDGDASLEYGELALLSVSLAGTAAVTGSGEVWTLDLLYGANGELAVSRRLPPELQPLMPLP